MKNDKGKITFRQAYREETERARRYEEAKQGLQNSNGMLKGIIEDLHKKHPNFSPDKIIEMAKEEMSIIDNENRAIIRAAIDEDKITR